MKFIAYDLGTGGVKASLYDETMQSLSSSFIEYETIYPKPDWHEQRPSDWWLGVIESTQVLLKKTAAKPEEISCIALSGHSCCAVPVDENLALLSDTVPIWSDKRAAAQVDAFFKNTDPDEWYMTTGNGCPPQCYALFKLMWMRENQPDLFARTRHVMGSKDYINMRLTGVICTDPSYASSFGAYDLKKEEMSPMLLAAAGIDASLFPPIVASHTLLGHLTEEAAEQIGLGQGVQVACGGVDNACMALGATGPEDGKAYLSLGSSSWVPMNSSEPILDTATKPYVFKHIQEGMYTSAYSIFAGGSSFKWVRDTICRDLAGLPDAYDRMTEMAASSPIGANGVFFNPSLAGGSSQDKSVHISGNFIGLHLGTTTADLIRAALEGITMNLRSSLELLAKKARLDDEILICGGGSKSAFWLQMFADVFGMNIIKTNIDQDAASLGAAAICARAMGSWEDYRPLPALHTVEMRCVPSPEAKKAYDRLYPSFRHLCDISAEIGEYLHHA